MGTSVCSKTIQKGIHLDCFRRRDRSSISEPWYTPPAAAPDATASTATPEADSDAAKVAELRE